MRIFLISKSGNSLDIARQLLIEGHNTLVYVKDKRIDISDVDVPITKNPTSEMIKSDLIIIEDDKSGEFAERARLAGRPVVGGGIHIDRLCHDVEFGNGILSGCDIKIAKENTKGMKVEVGGWFNGEEFLKPTLLLFKYPKFGTGDTGPDVGSMGMIGFYKVRNPIFNETLKKTSTFLKSAKYVGYCGLDCLVNDSTIHVSKWQPGLNLPVASIIGMLHNGLGNFLFKFATGKAKLVAVQPDKIGVGVVVLSPPFTLPKTNKPIMIKCAMGDTLDIAIARVYTAIKKLEIQDSYYRTDIGNGVSDNIKLLKQGGLL